MQSEVTLTTLNRMKKKGEKIVALTAYDYPFAKMVDESGVHIILVGDSLGMVVQGESSTLPVTMDEMIYHTKIVSKATKIAMVVGDMPFMSYQADIKDAVSNAGRFLRGRNSCAGAHRPYTAICPQDGRLQSAARRGSSYGGRS